MKLIKYIHLFKYLIEEEGLNAFSAYQSIQRVRQLPVEFKEAVHMVLEGKFPHLEYHEVTLEELTEKERMKPIRAIMMLDWIRREPAVAMRYMESEKLRAPQTITESDRKKVEEALKGLRQKKQESSSLDETDITVE